MRFASPPAPLAASLLGICLSTGLWTALSPGFAAAVSPAAPIHVQRYAMGTMFEIVAYHDPRGEAERAIGAAMTEIERLDAVMSHYRPDSDLARLIRTAPHGPVAIDPALYDVIEQSLQFSRLSRGRFDITIGPLVELWKRAYAEDTRPSDDDVAAALQDGRAMDAWKRMIAAQGGDPDATLPVAKETSQLLADTDGVLAELDAYAVGIAAWRLGAGRARKEDPVQAGAGVELHAKPGDTVRAGQPLMTLHTDTPERFGRALDALAGAVVVAPEGTVVPLRPLVIDRIDA